MTKDLIRTRQRRSPDCHPRFTVFFVAGVALLLASRGATAEPIRFQDPASFPAGPSLIGTIDGLSAGDFDGDGDTDVVCTTGTGRLLLMRNTGGGVFSAAVDLGAAPFLEFRTVADLDGDGSDDLAGVSPADPAGGITLCLRLGDPTASIVTISCDSAGMVAVLARDLDGDGVVDLAASNRGGQRVTVLYGDGAGGFPVAGAVRTRTSSAGRLAAGDPDGDGDLDLYASAEPYYPTPGHKIVSVLPNVGPRVYGPAQSILIDWYPIVHDFDGDGIPDAFTAMGISKGRPDFGFEPPSPIGSSAGSAEPFATFGDFDGDGRPDILRQLVVGGSLLCSERLDQRGGAFTRVESYQIGALSKNRVVAVDLDADGRDELLVPYGDGIKVFRAAGVHFDAPIIVHSQAFNDTPTGWAAADLTDDRCAELRVACKYSSGASYTNRGDGTFPQPQAFLGTYMRGLLLRDVDGDGRLDWISEQYDPGFRGYIYMGLTSGGGFSHRYSTLGHGILPGDFDGDGDLDFRTFENQMLFNHGAPSFQFAPTTLPAGSAFDFDGDRVDDIAVVTADSVVAHLNDGTGNAASRVAISTVEPLSAWTVADVDPDGRPELVGITTSGRTWLLRAAPGGPGVPTLGAALVSSPVTQVVVGNFNGDKVPDLVARTASEILALEGLGAGSYGAATSTARVAESIAPADLDGDGYDDLVWITESGRRTIFHLLFNRTGPDSPTPALVSNVSSEAFVDRVELVWQVRGTSPLIVERARGESEPWLALAERSPDGTGFVTFEDRDVTPGARLGYRLSLMDEHGARTAGEVWLEVPRTLAFGFARVWPNPTSGPLRIELALDTGVPAEIAVLDVAGRVLARRAIARSEAVTRTLRLDESERLAPGLYFLRVTQASKSAIQRVVRVQ